MRKHWTYFKHVLYHKWLMFGECRKLGLSFWTALVHDLDKFLPDEWSAHANAFACHNTYADTPEFLRAASLHTRRNNHHWQAWVLHRNDGRMIALEIPDKARREMLADWRASAKARGANLREWFIETRHNLILNTKTIQWIAENL